MFLRFLSVQLVFIVTTAWPLNQTHEDLYEIEKIVNEYIDTSALANPMQEGKMILRWAETVHACRKTTGITLRSDTVNYAEKELASIGKRPRDYWYEKNSEFEKSVPLWDVSPSDFDGVFDKCRFLRYLNWDDQPEFKRRSTWLYPDNGMQIICNWKYQHIME